MFRAVNSFNDERLSYSMGVIYVYQILSLFTSYMHSFFDLPLLKDIGLLTL